MVDAQHSESSRQDTKDGIAKLSEINPPGDRNQRMGYTKARLKINPDAFVYLNDLYLAMFYCEENEDFLDYKGYIPVAVGGTDLHLPASEGSGCA